jgi:hypothetical protein
LGDQLNRSSSNISGQFILIIASLAVLAGLIWVNYSFSRNSPGGNDFLVHYVGARSYLLEGLSPYSDEVAVRIQTAAYGHAAEGQEHQLRVAYPIYSLILFAPFALIKNYAFSRALWMTLLEASLIATVFVSFKLFRWRPPLWMQSVVLLFSITWYHAVRGVINGNAVVLISMGIAIILLLLQQEKDKWAGVVLAFTTIKPHLVLLFVLFLLIWGIYHKRWILIRWYFITLFGLIGVGLVLLPSWITQNIIEILRYPGYNPAGTLAAALNELIPGLSVNLKWMIGLSLTIVLLYEWWSGRNGDYDRFLWASLFTIGISQWIGIQTDPGNFILLFPALILILSSLDKRWSDKGLILDGIILLVIWIGLWVLFIATLERTYQPVQNPIMFLPMPAMILIGLYWIKWWVISPARFIWSDEP